MLKRSHLFLQKVISQEAGTIAAVSHRSVVKVILAAVIGLEKNYYWKFHLDNASVISYWSLGVHRCMIAWGDGMMEKNAG